MLRVGSYFSQVIIDRDIVCMEQPKGLIQDRNDKFVCMLENSLYGLLVLHARKFIVWPIGTQENIQEVWILHSESEFFKG